MSKHPFMKLAAVILCTCLPHAVTAAAIEVTQLRCEYLVDPLGIDVTQPRLSWQLASGQRGVSQSAYEVIVASSKDRLAPETADLWASGKVVSGQSIEVPYAGQPLTSRQSCVWKVRVWDQSGNVSDWSPPAIWSMGLLQPDDWRGQWIGKDEEPPTVELPSCNWIWFPEGQPEISAPLATRFFRRTFVLPADRTVKHAEYQLRVDSEFSCWVNGQASGRGDNSKRIRIQDIGTQLKPGRNVFAVAAKNTGAAASPAGLVGALKIEFESGDPLIITTGQDWKSSDQEAPNWFEPTYDDAAWTASKVLGPVGMQPWGMARDDTRRLAARMMRKEFSVTKPVARATAYLSGLGLSELYLNGTKVGDHVLSPALSEYPKRVFYVTHDVTTQLQPGRNALGVWLGNGRFYSPRTNPPNDNHYGFPKLKLQLEVDYVDGTRETVVSDASWKLTTDGPILANNEFDGEEYDARKELPGWASAGFQDAAWSPAQVVGPPEGALVAPMLAPIRVTGTLKPIALTEPKPGVFIFDLGQNMVGWSRLRVSGPAGTRVFFRHAEILKPDGTLSVENLRWAKSRNIYTLSGSGTEIYEPRFTYHGFRYVEVTGFPGRPTLDSLEGRVVNDDLATAGEFACSQPTINQVYRNIVWGTRGNYRSMPTDCPQRDERMAWLGDRSEECKGEAFLFDINALYAKWCQDMVDTQLDSGSISDVAPAYWRIYKDNVTWPSTLVIAPEYLRVQYGDTAIIGRIYPAMVKWVDHMSTFVEDGLTSRDHYGDWCVPPEDPKLIHSNDPGRKTSKTILATSYFYRCLKLMASYAQLLDKPADAQRFTALAETLKNAFNTKLYNPEKGYYDNGTQTSCVLPLAFDMVPAAERPRVFAHLVKKIEEETKGHIGTGLIGGQWINRVLTEGGRPDLAYRFATNTTYPSWGYMVSKGATTIWELWNGDTASVEMNSHNHVMLVGDLVIWLYESLAGIKSDPAQPGFKQIVMKPIPVGDLSFVRASHRSPYGLIASEWKRAGDKFDWQITVPANTTATVYVPTTDAASVTESGQPAAKASNVGFLRQESGAAVYTVGSGTYRFQSALPESWKQP